MLSAPFQLDTGEILTRIPDDDVSSANCDVEVIAESEEEMVAVVLKIKENFTKIGLRINQEKTKVMNLSRDYDDA